MIPKIDRVPGTGKNGWRKHTVVDAGSSGLAIGAEFKTKVEWADEPEVEGTNINRAVLVEFLAASGTTSGTATALTLAQTGFTLFDGALVRIKLHTALSAPPTLNINNMGAKPIVTAQGRPATRYSAGTWLTLVYEADSNAFVLQGGGDGEIHGSAIFENSGTFNPADYGLTIGDVITITCVGGGGGGQAGRTGSIARRGGNAGKGGDSGSDSGGGGGGGAGYGGGGGGGAGHQSQNGGGGGGSGYVVIKSHTIENLSGIPVTIGEAGLGGTGNGQEGGNGGSTSFGNILTALGGGGGNSSGGSGQSSGGSRGLGHNGTSPYVNGGGGGGAGGYKIETGAGGSGGNGGDYGNHGGSGGTNAGSGGSGEGYNAASSRPSNGGGGDGGLPGQKGGDGGTGKGVCVITW